MVYPPRNLGVGSDKILLNVLKIREADVIFFDVTPKYSKDKSLVSYNTGVMIELGIVLDQENLATPWGGRLPRPKFRLFCNEDFPRKGLSPILNEYSVRSYKSDPSGKKSLLSEIEDVLNQKISEKINWTEHSAGLSMNTL